MFSHSSRLSCVHITHITSSHSSHCSTREVSALVSSRRQLRSESDFHSFFFLLTECIKDMFLVRGRCETKCPVRWYRSLNAAGRPICLPCHYTCLTCAGDGDDQCTSCYDEAVAVPSGSKVTTPAPKPKIASEAEDMMKSDAYIKVEDLPVESHFGYGRRRMKRAVTKKILEPYDKPRTLYYCYPPRLLKEADSSRWYFRMSLLFGLNVVVLIGIAVYLAWMGLRRGKNRTLLARYRYTRMKNGETRSGREGAGESVLYASSTDEE